MGFSIAIHGGAGARPSMDYTLQKDHLGRLIVEGEAMLKGGRGALDVVTEMVWELERSGLYVAGRGSSPNDAGVVEQDASVMCGPDRQAGAVSAVSGVESPVRAARQVMEKTDHVMLTGQGALRFAGQQGLALVSDPDTYYTPADRDPSVDARHGTVGAVVLDTNGILAAATSTGGTFDKMSGRVGDTPIVGAGTWADELVAVSCTGVGEAFMRGVTAFDLSARLRYGGADLGTAAQGALDQVKALGGEGGLIAIDRQGRIVMPYNSQGMKRAAASDLISPYVQVFEPSQV